MKSPNPIIFPALFLLFTTYLINAKTHFTSHSLEIHVLHHNKALHPNKRDFLTCEETYGEGAISCGGSDSQYCYDPTIGEVSFLMICSVSLCFFLYYLLFECLMMVRSLRNFAGAIIFSSPRAPLNCSS